MAQHHRQDLAEDRPHGGALARGPRYLAERLRGASREFPLEILWLSVAEDQHPETPDEDAFVQRFGRSIELVYKTLVRYRSTRSVGYVNTAYTEVYKLFGDLDAGIAQQYKVPNAKLSIQNTAPKLLLLKDCILTVPGEPIIPIGWQLWGW